MKRHMRITAFLLCVFIGLFFSFQSELNQDRDGNGYGVPGQECVLGEGGMGVLHLTAVRPAAGRQWGCQSMRIQVFLTFWGIRETMQEGAKYGFWALLILGTFLLAQSLDILHIIQATDGKKREKCVCFHKYAI